MRQSAPQPNAVGMNRIMAAIRLDRWLEYFTGEHLLLTIVWLGLVGVTVALMVMMVTRWGQSQPLKKCVVLSLLTHLLLATYATTIEIVAASPREQLVQATLIDTPPAGLDERPGEPAESGAAAARPWEHFATSTPLEADAPDIERPTMPADDPRREAAPVSPLLPTDLPVARLPADEIHRPQGEVAVDETSIADTAEATEAEAIDAPTAARREAVNPALSDETGPQRAAAAMNSSGPARTLSPTPRLPGELRDASDLPRLVDLPSSAPTPLVPTTAGDRQARSESPVAPEKVASGTRRRADDPTSRNSDLLSTVRRGGAGGLDATAAAPGGLAADADLLGGPLLAPRGEAAGMPAALPRVYERRAAPRKAEIIAAEGGSPASEAAVKLALKWLAEHQSADGRWDASEFGAGQERRIDGHNRGGAGVEADTGVTGLALLAFLGNGHTHVSGEKESEYRETVERGLSFLLASQKSDGNLGGAADRFAMMYCHGMAALALSEAYAMTQDERLLAPVRKAIGYTLVAQHRASGGWRYKPGETVCDTSQLGWQLMALKSAELAGIEIPQQARQGMLRFLQTVSSGRHGGLASYRPMTVAGERATVSMTAEALVCRQFLGLARNHPACDEAGSYIATSLPGRGPSNFYYWYYATLAMFQLQGEHWQRWKNALEPTLIASQRREDDLAGSWDPDPIWGGHGGRVYSTALGALCLEVYYRFLPLYVQSSLEPGEK